MSGIKPPAPPPSTLGDHLDDLRRAMVRSIVVPILLIIGIWPFWTDIFVFIRDGLLTTEQIARLTSIRALDTFSMSVRLSVYAAVVISIPWVVWNIWWFIKPGLYPHERRFGHIAIPSSILLFVMGVAFGYFFVIPATLNFLLEFGRDIAPNQIQDVQDLFDLVFALLFVMGGTFQIPLIVAAAIRFRLIKSEWITRHRRIVIMVSAILGAVLTPTGDVVTMSLVGLPIYFLIEGGTLIGRFWKATVDRRAAKEPKSIAQGFKEGLADGAIDGDGILGGNAAEGLGETLRRLSREFADNVKEGLEEIQRPTGENPNADDDGGTSDDGDSGPRGGPDSDDPSPKSPPSAPSASTSASVQAERSAPTAPVAAPVSKPVTPTTVAPRAPIDGTPSNTPQTPDQIPSASSSPGQEVPMLPRELRRRIDAYIEGRLEEILGDLKQARESKPNDPKQPE